MRAAMKSGSRSILIVVLTLTLSLSGCSAYRKTVRIETESVFLVFQIESIAKDYNLTSGHGYLMHRMVNGQIVVADRFFCSFGKYGYPKRFEGDKKTPLGKYQVIRKNRNPWNYYKFGPATLLINYPNKYDSGSGYTGGGIVIHGGRVASTYGCIRVLDGDEDNPRFGKRNMKKIFSQVPLYAKVFIADKIRADLLGDRGKILSIADSQQWSYLLDEDISNEWMLELIVR